jgi:hypothetical protein
MPSIKRLLATAMTLLLLLSGIPLPVAAAVRPPDGFTPIYTASDLSAMRGNPSGSYNSLSGTLSYDFEDNFGLDHGDLDDRLMGIRYGSLPVAGIGFRAWYILQHDTRWRGAHRPFHTRVSLQLNASTKTFN